MKIKALEFSSDVISFLQLLMHVAGYRTFITCGTIYRL